MPEPYQDLVYSLHRCQQYYNKARIERVPEGNRELLRQYMTECKRLLEMQMAPAPAANVPAGAATSPPMPPGPPAGAPPPMPAPPPGAPPMNGAGPAMPAAA